MFSFEHIEFLTGLLLLVPLVLIFIFTLQRKQKTKKALGDEQLINKLTQDYSARRYKIKFVAVLFAFTLHILLPLCAFTALSDVVMLALLISLKSKYASANISSITITFTNLEI